MKQNHPIFRGIATALITPTTPTGIDYDRFGRLIDWQIQQGINALVICGTTGESSTLTDAEHRRAIAFACERVNVPTGPTRSWWSRPITTRPPSGAW